MPENRRKDWSRHFHERSDSARSLQRPRPKSRASSPGTGRPLPRAEHPGRPARLCARHARMGIPAHRMRSLHEMRARAHPHQYGLCRRQSARRTDVHRRGSRRGRGRHRRAVRGTRGRTALPDDRRHDVRPQDRNVHREHREMPPARKPQSGRRRGGGVHALPETPDRHGEPEGKRAARRGAAPGPLHPQRHHPAFLLRNPPAKKDAWADLQAVMAVFGRKPAPRR